ncbi:MAG: hypothetical protein ABI687_08620, partial [Flavitalea sp.]
MFLIFSAANAQSDSSLAGKGKDTVSPKSKGTVLTRKKGILRKLAQSITTDTSQPVDNNLQRIDLLYRMFKGRTIRSINVQLLDFGVPINDTLRSFKNKLTRLADYFHHTTREYVIRNNLFFKKYDTLLPYLIADNERHLRDQVYLGDARIVVEASPGTMDSVDVTVLIKDVLSLGGAFKVGSLKKVEVVAREDNFMGLGDRLQFGTFYEYSRRRRLGYGGEYITRNIAGSFVDGYFGYQNYASAFNTGAKQETTIYTRFIKPLVNPYMKWTYALEGAYHKTSN